jgi:hypothetical protein
MIDRLSDWMILSNVNECEKTKVMRISRQTFPIQATTHQKQLEDMEYFNYLGCMTTNYARCTREIKSRIATAKGEFNNNMTTLFTSKSDLNLKRKLAKCNIWSRALHGTEMWTLQRVDQKYLESTEMQCWRRKEITWTDHVKNRYYIQTRKKEI